MNILFRIGCLGAFLTGMTRFVAGADDWWVKSVRDADWTNKPLAEIESAAKRGDAKAQFYYARDRFLNAKRIEDWSESFRWVMPAAEAGLADAQFMAARFHLSGTATAKDPRTGFKWAARAAEQGHADGLALLADSYASASGTTQNVARARELFGQAIAAGSVLALDWLGHFYLDGEAGTAARTNYAEALRCFERAASNGMAHAASHAINMNREGIGTPPNVERAIFWARTFTKQRDVAAAEALAGFYAQGLVEPRDAQDRSVVLILGVAEWRARPLDHDDGATASLHAYFALTGQCRDLATRYRYGIGTARDYIASATWMLVAYRQDVVRDRNKDIRREEPLHPFADAARLTNSVSGEEGLWQEALRRIYRALERADATTCRAIGLSYRDGSALTPQDNIMAHLWLTRAQELSESKAASELAELELRLRPNEIALAKKRFLPRSKH
jgi:TPR repeat protein